MQTTLPLDQLIADPAVHPRTRIRQGTIRQYAASYKEGDTLPPVDVFKAPDGRHFLADGFHRYYGARAAGHADIAVELFEGDVREATRYACGANARHAVPRTREDKWFEVAAFLCESEFAGATDAEIAKTCRVSRQMIAKVRPRATSKDDFDQYMKDEAERRTLAREDRQIARKKAKAEAKAAPLSPDPPPVPDRPLTPQEEAMAALARAAEAAGLARKAMAECGRAYPEANRFEAMIAICEAQCQLDELVPPIDAPAQPEASTQQMLSLLKEFGVDLQAQPEKLQPEVRAPIPARSGSDSCGAGVPPAGSGDVVPAGGTPAPQRLPTRRVSEVNTFQPLPPHSAAHQPAKLHGSLPAPSHSWGGLGRGAEVLSTSANSKSCSAGSQPAKLQPAPNLTPQDLPAPRRIPSEKLADLFAPKPIHPMIAALSEGTIRNVPEVLPIQAKWRRHNLLPIHSFRLNPQSYILLPPPNPRVALAGATKSAIATGRIRPNHLPPTDLAPRSSKSPRSRCAQPQAQRGTVFMILSFHDSVITVCHSRFEQRERGGAREITRIRSQGSHSLVRLPPTCGEGWGGGRSFGRSLSMILLVLSRKTQRSCCAHQAGNEEQTS